CKLEVILLICTLESVFLYYRMSFGGEKNREDQECRAKKVVHRLLHQSCVFKTDQKWRHRITHRSQDNGPAGHEACFRCAGYFEMRLGTCPTPKGSTVRASLLSKKRSSTIFSESTRSEERRVGKECRWQRAHHT